MIRYVFFLAGAALLLMATSASALLLRFAGGSDLEWARLANIGQAAGAVSALISAVALVGIVATIRNQLAQRRIEHVLSRQQRHHDMMRYVFEDPQYSQCWGPKVAPEGVDDRLFYYTNIILGEWQAAYELGELSADDIRHYAATMVDSEIPRMFWRQHGGLRRMTTRRKATGDFALIVEEEYRRATASGPPARTYERPAPPERPGARWLIVGAIGVVVAATVGAAARRSARRSDAPGPVARTRPTTPDWPAPP